MPITALNTILKLFNLIWTKGTLPTSWKHAKCFILPKREKDKAIPNNCRRITLTSYKCKSLETVINKKRDVATW